MSETNEMAEKGKGGAVPALRLAARAAVAAAGAGAVYALTFAGYLFPGESAHLATQWMGMDAMALPTHPLWGLAVKAAAALSPAVPLATALNALSLLCGALSTGLLYLLVAFFVRQTVTQEDAVRRVRGAANAAGATAAFAFTFAAAAWQSATHLDYRMFDVCVALAAFALLVPMAGRPKLIAPLAAVLGAAVGAGAVESPVFIALAPVYLLALAVTAVKAEKRFYVPAVLFLAFGAAAFVVVMNAVAGAFTALPEAAAAGLADKGEVWAKMIAAISHEMRLWLSRPGWLYVFVLSVVPFVACAFAAARGLNNERTWAQYAFHAAMTFCAVLAVATPLSPESVMRPFAVSPVTATALVAAVCGYLAAYWYLLARMPVKAKESGEAPDAAETAGARLAPAAGCAFAGLVILSAVVNAFAFSKDRGAFADACAEEILARMGDRTWLVTDGRLDDHLRAVAAAKGRELNLICLQRDMDDAYLKELSALVKAKNLSAGAANLPLSLQLGVLPFLQDWFAGDTNVEHEAAVFGVPDFWHMAGCQPVSECLFFGGVRSLKTFDGAKARADFEAFWKKMEPLLYLDDPRAGSRAIVDADDPVDALRMQLRRHVGFLANNLGVTLQDAGRDADAFALYELVLKTIDRDNICALFNEFEMARAGVKEAAARRADIERQLKAVVDDSSRRYLLWSLSRYYGYIRAPEIFARMGYAWARSGQTGNAIAQVQRAINFIPEDRQSGLLNMMAAIYASGQQAGKSREIYQKVLAADENNHEALMGLTRLSLQAGALDDAKKYLSRAIKGAKPETSGFDWALLHMMNNDLSAARMALQKVTDLQPKSLQAWSLLAGVLLQQVDTAKDEAVRKKTFEELENVILPKMESLAASPRDYFVQMTRALVWMRKGDAFRKQARDALVAASQARPDVNVVGDMILNLDIAMDDGDGAEKHARHILRQDRSNRLANYIMGSLRLKEGDYATAETFLRLAVDQERPIAAAQNDLAEVLRRLQRFDEAEAFARSAVRTAPDLYVAWETLGASLLDQKKNLDEAEECVKKAIYLSKEKNKVEDLRMQLTLARVQIAKGDLGKARGTLRSLRARQGDLSKYDREQLESLMKASAAKK